MPVSTAAKKSHIHYPPEKCRSGEREGLRSPRPGQNGSCAPCASAPHEEACEFPNAPFKYLLLLLDPPFSPAPDFSTGDVSAPSTSNHVLEAVLGTLPPPKARLPGGARDPAFLQNGVLSPCPWGLVQKFRPAPGFRTLLLLAPSQVPLPGLQAGIGPPRAGAGRMRPVCPRQPPARFCK